MKIQIITFLGLNPKKTTYRFAVDKEFSGDVFPQALREYYDESFDEMLVCVTDKAKRTFQDTLEKLGDPRIQAIEIPDGKNDDELWDMFVKITKHVDVGNEVIFDITHGFRHMPFLVFLFAAYLKTVRNVTIKQVLYGAFDQQGVENIAPVIDLSRFISMLDWMNATNRFTQTGDSNELENLIKDNPYRSDQITKLTNKINNISLSLQLARPIETLNSSANLEIAFNTAQEQVDNHIKPLAVLSPTIIKSYADFGLDLSSSSPPKEKLLKNINKQLAMLNWYIDKKMWIQCATLGRELLVTALAFNFGEFDICDEHKVRFPIEKAINNFAAIQRQETPKEDSKFDNIFSKLHKAKEIQEFWSKFNKKRNSLLHAGMKSKYQPSQDIVTEIKDSIPYLKEIIMEICNDQSNSKP